MALMIVFAGTRQPLPAGTRVYAVEVGDDKQPKGGPVRSDVQSGGKVAGGFNPLGHPAGLEAIPFAPTAAGKYQVIAIPASQDFGSPGEAWAALRRCPPLTFADDRLPAVMVQGLRKDQVEPPVAGGVAVRFRAVAKDGEELVSSAISLRSGGPGPRLALPRFGQTQARVGELVTLKVFARALEGTNLRFEVEVQNGGDWKPAGSTDGKVAAGAAVAQWLIPPALLPMSKSAADDAKPAGKLRFHAIAEFENLLSAPLPLLPPVFVAPPKPAPAAAKPTPAAAKPTPAAAKPTPVAVKPAPAAAKPVQVAPGRAPSAARPAPVAAKPAPQKPK